MMEWMEWMGRTSLTLKPDYLIGCELSATEECLFLMSYMSIPSLLFQNCQISHGENFFFPASVVVFNIA